MIPRLGTTTRRWNSDVLCDVAAPYVLHTAFAARSRTDSFLWHADACALCPLCQTCSTPLQRHIAPQTLLVSPVDKQRHPPATNARRTEGTGAQMLDTPRNNAAPHAARSRNRGAVGALRPPPTPTRRRAARRRPRTKRHPPTTTTRTRRRREASPTTRTHNERCAECTVEARKTQAALSSQCHSRAQRCGAPASTSGMAGRGAT